MDESTFKKTFIINFLAQEVHRIDSACSFEDTLKVIRNNFPIYSAQMYADAVWEKVKYRL